MGLKALVSKMAFLVIIVIGGLAQVLIFLLRWLIAVTVISSRGLGRIDPVCRGGALRPRAAGAATVTIPILLTLLVSPARSFQDLSSLGTMRRHGLCLLRAERKGASDLGVIFGRF